ncbi:ankyrin, partial [Zopfia rhizophila CBS 207.26]
TAIQEATERNGLEMVQMLLEHGASPDTVTQCSPYTGLQIACRDGNKAIMELLLGYGANVNAPPVERYGATALQFAAIGGYLGIAFLLLAKGVDVNVPPAEFEGRPALEGAAEHGRIDMVQLLKNAGGDISEAG